MGGEKTRRPKFVSKEEWKKANPHSASSSPPPHAAAATEVPLPGPPGPCASIIEVAEAHVHPVSASAASSLCLGPSAQDMAGWVG